MNYNSYLIITNNLNLKNMYADLKLDLKCLNGETITLEILARYYPPHRGYRDKYGAPEEPDEDEFWDFEVVNLNGSPIEDEEIEKLTGLNYFKVYDLFLKELEKKEKY